MSCRHVQQQAVCNEANREAISNLKTGIDFESKGLGHARTVEG
jgi:hypothetical protein